MPTDSNAFPSVWARPAPTPRSRPSLNREQIVAAAIELLDDKGVEALSMRKLGTRLNAGATSMYSHVATKDELLELVVDEIYGQVPPPAVDGDWRGAVIRCAHDLRSTFLRHPWIVSVLGEAGVAHLGPNMLRLSEALLAAFEKGGFTLVGADRAVNTLIAYVVGTATSEAAWLTRLARNNLEEREWAEELWPAAERAVREYPRLRELYAARRLNPVDGRGEEFGEGLACVLDGLVTRFGEH